MELNKIVKAEEQAEKIVQDAEKRHEEAIAQALQEREASLGSIKPPAKAVITPQTPLPNLKDIEEVAQQRKEPAVRAILEAFRAAT